MIGAGAREGRAQRVAHHQQPPGEPRDGPRGWAVPAQGGCLPAHGGCQHMMLSLHTQRGCFTQEGSICGMGAVPMAAHWMQWLRKCYTGTTDTKHVTVGMPFTYGCGGRNREMRCARFLVEASRYDSLRKTRPAEEIRMLVRVT